MRKVTQTRFMASSQMSQIKDANMKRSNQKGKALTREAVERISRELGIEVAGPDNPIYREPVTVNFINRPSKSGKVKKPDLKN